MHHALESCIGSGEPTLRELDPTRGSSQKIFIVGRVDSEKFYCGSGRLHFFLQVEFEFVSGLVFWKSGRAESMFKKNY